jgi:hypothetical protein
LSEFLDFIVFIEKACCRAIPICMEAGILAVSFLFAYLVARLNSLDGRRRRSIIQTRLVCLGYGEVPP